MLIIKITIKIDINTKCLVICEIKINETIFCTTKIRFVIQSIYIEIIGNPKRKGDV
jgi:hypothetical protein